jgi:hypothetical protein
MTGIGRFLCNFLQHAVRTRPECEFILYGNQHTSYEADPGTNITLRRVPERVTLWWDQVVLPRLASQDELDLFLSPYMKGPYRVECPLIVTIHDLLLLRLPEYTVWIRCLENWLRTWSAARVAGRADRILTVFEHARRDIESILGVRKARLSLCQTPSENRFTRLKIRRRSRQSSTATGSRFPISCTLGISSLTRT